MSKDLYKMLGLKQKDLLDMVTSAFKMYWEQVLLLCFSARQYYFENSSRDSFHQRMKLVHILKTTRSRESSSIIHDLYKQLETDCGSTEIIKYLLEEEKDRDLTYTKRSILQKMEENGIAFPAEVTGYTASKRHYSYDSLYKALSDPIKIFQGLLNIPEPNALTIEQTVIKTVEKYLKHKKREKYFGRQDSRDNTDEARSIDFILENEQYIVKEEINKLVKGQLADFIGRKIRPVFNSIFEPDFGVKQGEEFKLFAEIVSVEPYLETVNLSINRKLLSTLGELNQIDELMRNINLELSEILKGRGAKSSRYLGVEFDEKMEQGDVLEKVSEWYMKAGTGLLNRLDQIPRMVASILEFDIRYLKGLFDIDFGFNANSLTQNQGANLGLPANEIYTLVSVYIRNYLYYGRDDWLWPRESYNGLLIDHLINKEMQGVNLLANPVMESWAKFESDEEKKKMLDRFKRLPPYLSPKRFKSVSPLISEQKEVGKERKVPAYPLNSFFPLPLWTNRISLYDSDGAEKEDILKPDSLH